MRHHVTLWKAKEKDVARIPSRLIRMKEEANRQQDRADIEQLRAGKDNDANG